MSGTEESTFHCWADRHEHAAKAHGFGTDAWWAEWTKPSATCMRPSGHSGDHAWTNDTSIAVEFPANAEVDNFELLAALKRALELIDTSPGCGGCDTRACTACGVAPLWKLVRRHDPEDHLPPLGTPIPQQPDKEDVGP